MNYVITGSLGNISRPIVEKLVAAGNQVKVITHRDDRVAEIEALGANALVGDVEDAAFVQNAFKGADAVYTMVPPTWAASDWKKHIAHVGRNYADAIRTNRVKWVVNLSSIGAHLPDGVGPVSGLHFVEKALNEIPGINVLSLRPGYFYSNFYGSMPLIKHMNILGSNVPANGKMIMSHTSDIADAAASALLNIDFSGINVRYLVSDERDASEVASVIGAAIGKPELPWVEFSDEQSMAGLLQAGLSEEVARNYTEMGAAMRTGIMYEDYLQTNMAEAGHVKLEDFAKQFAQAWQAA